MIVAIDGPAGAGKSTVARGLAARLGFRYLDTGAMYRAVTWLALREGVDLSQGALVGQLAAMLMLLAPALWNGFPLLQYDSGGYFARWYEGTLEESRSTVYGLFAVALARPNFWPLIVVQAAATVWIIALVQRVHGLGRPLALFLTVAIL